ncbi:alpha/beta hydrolase [Hylemonella sp. W303a]|uniref:alpha/beta hydrolase n=1 Tax=Hylemonella sp. W303a TaxID=3389873 RepID=UPI00396B2CEE
MQTPDPGASAALQLPYVQVQDVQDTASGAVRRLFISRAGHPADGPAQRLLILLDGNLSAPPAALMLQTHADRSARIACGLPPCMVVGVGYPDARFHDRARRVQDFLPALPPGRDAQAWDSGAADAFADFLDGQLLPWLEAQQGSTLSEIGLYGHSYGGLFTLYKLLRQPGRFHAFFSISPSLWWADGWLLTQLTEADARCRGRTVYLGIGADERALPGDDAQRVAQHAHRDVQGRFAQLATELQSRTGADTRLQIETLAGEDHGSVIYPTLTRAVRWLTLAPPRARNTSPDTARPAP